MKPNNYYLHLMIKRKAIQLEIMKLIFITWYIRLVWKYHTLSNKNTILYDAYVPFQTFSPLRVVPMQKM